MAGLKDIFSLRGSIAARLAVGYGLLIALAVAALSTLFYFGTVGVFERSLDNRIKGIGTRLIYVWHREGEPGLLHEIGEELHDRVDSDTELIALLDADGRVVAGNLARWQADVPPRELVFETMQRASGPVSVRVLALPLDKGRRLVIGRDLSELDGIRGVIEHALAISVAASLLLAFLGAQLFRRLIEARIGSIRRTAARIAGGELSSRITVRGNDEFARLGADINQMLDRIESLMEGVRHVSNSIAHDLRTPVTRVRSRLERALHAAAEPKALVGDARLAIEEIDNVISLFDKLLQIAAAETGVRTRSFDTLDLAAIAHDMVELYELVADEQGVLLRFVGEGPVTARGDRDLLAGALASLIDNAVKYARMGVKVDVGARRDQNEAVVWVRDYGQGVPEADLERICERFYRVDQSRHLPGNGLGLSSVTAIAQLHGARLRLRNAHPGLEVSLVFSSR